MCFCRGRFRTALTFMRSGPRSAQPRVRLRPGSDEDAAGAAGARLTARGGFRGTRRPRGGRRPRRRFTHFAPTSSHLCAAQRSLPPPQQHTTATASQPASQAGPAGGESQLFLSRRRGAPSKSMGWRGGGRRAFVLPRLPRAACRVPFCPLSPDGVLRRHWRLPSSARRQGPIGRRRRRRG